MTGQAFVSIPIPRDAGVTARWWLALAVSASFHLLIVQSLAPDVPRRPLQAAGILPMKVRIERLPAPAAGGPAGIEAEARLDPVRVERPSPVAVAAPAGLPRAAPVAPSLALPQLPDPTVYTARDLDSYPRPVAPLDTGRIEDPVAGQPVSVRLELTIDEHGVVNEVAVAGPEAAGYAETELRALLAVTRFIPARKDGRAVKSRVLLSVSLAARDGSR